mmetsp:Transcript_36279/g.69878  ORF Transcript_36279/g.69878 Transcript_36279/m.69878 type:complete len:308 (-) Transcript_36279:633-1556(-)
MMRGRFQHRLVPVTTRHCAVSSLPRVGWEAARRCTWRCKPQFTSRCSSSRARWMSSTALLRQRPLRMQGGVKSRVHKDEKKEIRSKTVHKMQQAPRRCLGRRAMQMWSIDSGHALRCPLALQTGLLKSLGHGGASQPLLRCWPEPSRLIFLLVALQPQLAIPKLLHAQPQHFTCWCALKMTSKNMATTCGRCQSWPCICSLPAPLPAKKACMLPSHASCTCGLHDSLLNARFVKRQLQPCRRLLKSSQKYQRPLLNLRKNWIALANSGHLKTRIMTGLLVLRGEWPLLGLVVSLTPTKFGPPWPRSA